LFDEAACTEEDLAHISRANHEFLGRTVGGPQNPLLQTLGIETIDGSRYLRRLDLQQVDLPPLQLSEGAQHAPWSTEGALFFRE
jgi:hypothetical protein